MGNNSNLERIRIGGYDLMFPLDFCGTLCARDGIKTGSATPNGEDAYDKKLVVMCRKKRFKFFTNHQTRADSMEVNVSPTMGASRNLNASNYNPLVVSVVRKGNDKCGQERHISGR